MHLHTSSIPASMCISDFTRSQSPSASVNSLDHGLQVYVQTRLITAGKFAPALPPSASPNSLGHGLQVSLQTGSITACKFARAWPPSASPNSLDHGLGVYLCVHSIVIFRRTSNCSQALPATSPDIACVDGSLYRYIDT